jgi:hypothetical protein
MKFVTMLVSAACLLSAVPAQAQQPRMPAVDCSRSFLALNPNLTCMVPHYVNQSKVSTKDFFTSGLIGDTSIYMVLSTSYVASAFRPYSEQDSVAILKGLNDVTRKQGKDWSPIKSEGNSSYMSFKTEREDCIAFDHAGPLKDAGYAWVLRGYLCAPAGAAPRFDTVRNYLAATRVGNTRDNLNAFGQPVRPLQAVR